MIEQLLAERARNTRNGRIVALFALGLLALALAVSY